MDRRQNNGSVKAVSPRHCAATSALRSCCFNRRAGQSHKYNVRCTFRTTRSERSPTFAAQLYLPTHDHFWANLRVRLHLPPLDLAWNPVLLYSRRNLFLLFLLGADAPHVYVRAWAPCCYLSESAGSVGGQLRGDEAGKARLGVL